MNRVTTFVIVLGLAAFTLAAPPTTLPTLTSIAELDAMIPKGVVPHGDEQWNDLKQRQCGR